MTHEAVQNGEHRLQLNNVESTLRRLLLDVASYINPDCPSELRFTGGWVRDKLLGVGSHDIDVAINDMTGYQFGLKMKEYLEQPGISEKYGLDGVATTDESSKAKGKSAVVAGLHKIEANPEKSKHLETVTTKIFGLDIDLVNLRKETYTEDSRNPQMEFGTPEEDALRRDATINAMFYNLRTEIVEDFTGHGHDDMRDKVIRTPLEPYQTFKDDPLRVLRLIRFASRLNYTIDESAKQAMSEEGIREALKAKISRERVGVEFEKMLRGPDPYGALTLIDELGLYNTIFTDPSTSINFKPEVSVWRSAYHALHEILSDSSPSLVKEILLADDEQEYIAWNLATFTAWFNAPVPQANSKGKTPLHVAVLAAREGYKAPNKLCDVIGASFRDVVEIIKLKDLVSVQYKFKRLSQQDDLTGREALGMAIRRWGTTWRNQAVYALLSEVSKSTKGLTYRLDEWNAFLSHIKDLDLLDAYDFRPVIDGKALSSALGFRPGPWMKQALDVVMAWQLRNPTTATVEGAIEQVKNNQAQQAKGELIALLIRHFLTLTIRPLFAKATKQTLRNVTAQARKVVHQPVLPERFVGAEEDEEAARAWKNDPFTIDILTWVLRSLDTNLAELHWPSIVPPILTLLDDVDVKYKACGCNLLSELLKFTTSTLLARTGLGSVFDDALTPCLSYLPTITPEDQSQLLLNAAYPALLALTAIRFSPPDSTAMAALPSQHIPSPYTKHLSLILYTHIIPSINQISDIHPALAVTLFAHLHTFVTALGLDTIAHLVHLIPLLSETLSQPFASSYPPLLSASAQTLQAIIANSWPRVWRWRADVLGAVCTAWENVCEEEGRWKEGDEISQQLKSVKRELKVVVDMVVSVCEATNDEESVDVKEDIKILIAADGREPIKELFDKHLSSY